MHGWNLTRKIIISCRNVRHLCPKNGNFRKLLHLQFPNLSELVYIVKTSSSTVYRVTFFTYFILHRLDLHVFCNSFRNRSFFRWNGLFCNWRCIRPSSKSQAVFRFDPILFFRFAWGLSRAFLFPFSWFSLGVIFSRRRYWWFIFTWNVQILWSAIISATRFSSLLKTRINEHRPWRICFWIYKTWILRK